jgi:hypothetical protein
MLSQGGNIKYLNSKVTSRCLLDVIYGHFKHHNCLQGICYNNIVITVWWPLKKEQKLITVMDLFIYLIGHLWPTLDLVATFVNVLSSHTVA